MRCISSTSFCMASSFGAFADQGERQFEAGEHRAQIVADAVEHRGALLHRPFDPALHFDEGIAGLPHLARAVRPEVGVAAFAERFGRARQTQDRSI